MVRFLILACALVLAGCASVETRLRERRADRETIDESFSSPDPLLRKLAAESCVWSRTKDCEDRLEDMARWDGDAAVRAAAVRTLGSICGDDARRILVRLFRAVPLRDALSDAAETCPTADLALALHGDRSPSTLEEQERYLSWLEGVVKLPAPRASATDALDRTRRGLEREYAEIARAREIAEMSEEVRSALAAGNLSLAVSGLYSLARAGVPGGELGRQAGLLQFGEAHGLLNEALRKGDPDAAQAILSEWPALATFDPTVDARIEFARHALMEPRAAKVEKLARSGAFDEAQAEWRRIEEEGGRPVLVDRAKAARFRAEALVAKRNFADAWKESWMLRQTDSSVSRTFIEGFAAARWKHEGLRMSRAQLTAFVEDVGEHAPSRARDRLALLRNLELARAADSAAAKKAIEQLLGEVRRATEECTEPKQLPAPMDEFSVGEMPDLLEYAAERTTSSKSRVELRRLRDEGRAIQKTMGKQEWVDHAAAVLECKEPLLELAWYEDSPPGSEAHAKARSAATRVHRCLTDAAKGIDAYQLQGSMCLGFIERATDALRRSTVP